MKGAADEMNIEGVSIKFFTIQESLNAALKASRDNPKRIFFVNAHCINIARTNADYRRALNDAEILLNDGAGIELAAFILGGKAYENLNGTDWIPKFLDQPVERRVFVLGATRAVVEHARRVFADRWPHHIVVGVHEGFYDDEEKVLTAIEQAMPDTLLVCVGVPKQELFLDNHWQRLTQAGVQVGIAGGAILDFLTGQVPRAPLWLRRLRLEWAYRLLVEPERLWKRYLVGNVLFLWHVILQKFRIGRRNE